MEIASITNIYLEKFFTKPVSKYLKKNTLHPSFLGAVIDLKKQK